MNDSAIRTNGLTKRYGAVLAVDNVTLNLPAGRVSALMGRNGAGKTSLIKMLLGLIPISAGDASVLGLDSRTADIAIRQRVGYVPEEHHMYSWMTVAEITQFTSAFYSEWDADLCATLLERFALDPGKRIQHLSRGMVAKTALTLALAHRPEMLILDEPTSGLDAVVRRDFLGGIIDVAADEGRTVLISSHHLSDVERVADDVILMDRGAIGLVEDLATLRERMREVKVTFAGDAPEPIELPGVLSLTRDRREWTVVLGSFGAGTMAELHEQLPGAVLEERTLTLEEMFVAQVSATGESGGAKG